VLSVSWGTAWGPAPQLAEFESESETSEDPGPLFRGATFRMVGSTLATCLAALLLPGGDISARTTEGHAALIEEAQALPASRIDSSQKAVPLKAWLTELVGADAEASWQVSSCDLKPDDSTPEETWPLCVEFTARQKDNLGVRLHIDLGTFGHPDPANARVHRQSFAWWWCLNCDTETAAKECTVTWIDSLESLVAARDQLRERPACR